MRLLKRTCKCPSLNLNILQCLAVGEPGFDYQAAVFKDEGILRVQTATLGINKTLLRTVDIPIKYCPKCGKQIQK